MGHPSPNWTWIWIWTALGLGLGLWGLDLGLGLDNNLLPEHVELPHVHDLVILLFQLTTWMRVHIVQVKMDSESNKTQGELARQIT